MEKPVSKMLPPVDATEQERAAYEAIQLSAEEADSLVQPSPKPAQD